MAPRRCVLAAFLVLAQAVPAAPSSPGWLVVHTWPYTGCAAAAADVLSAGGSALDAVVSGATAAERNPDFDSVGWGAHPDAAGEPTLDALVMCGRSRRVGAVGALRSVKDAARVARLVLEHTSHSLLVGSQATEFAATFGRLPVKSLRSDASDAAFAAWTNNSCQPNFWRNTEPAPSSGCGPFQPASTASSSPSSGARPPVTPDTHDTLSIAARDVEGNWAAATSTNGLALKIPGRVGDAAVPGSGNYAVNGVGACGSTGDGDVLMRFLPCYQVVESLRMGSSPLDAAEDALARIRAVSTDFTGAVFAVNAAGEHAGAAHNWVFTYSVLVEGDAEATVYTVKPRPGIEPRGPAAPVTPIGQLAAAALAGAIAAFVLLSCQWQHGVAAAVSADSRAPLRAPLLTPEA